MTKPLPAASRKRRKKRFLKDGPGTLAAIVKEYAREKKYTPAVLANYNYALRNLMEVAGHQPTPADLTADNLDAVRLLLESNNVAAQGVVKSIWYLKKLWKWCGERGLTNDVPPRFMPPSKLSDAEGTLWNICKTLYFPRCIRIGSESTRRLYQNALQWFKAFLGGDATLADLTDDNCTGLMLLMRSKSRAPETINSTVGRLKTLWNWLARRRITPDFPTFQNLKEPKRVPRAWSRDELNRILAACQHLGGKVGKVWADDWWTALHLVIWDSGERITATLSIRKNWINWQTGDLVIPAESRKGQECDMAYKLHANTLVALGKIRDNDSDLLFAGMDFNRLYFQYKKIRRAAGVDLDRKSAFHRIRRSVASHLHAGGHNATDALGHASAEVTRKSYLDPSIAGAVRPSDVLFRIGEPDDGGLIVMGKPPAEPSGSVIALDVPAHEAKRLPRAKLLKGGVA